MRGGLLNRVKPAVHTRWPDSSNAGLAPGRLGHGRCVGISLQGGQLAVDRFIAAPSETVWNLLVDLEAWPKWGATVTAARLDEGDVLTLGVTGLVWTPVGIPLPFTIDEFVPGRSWGWRVAGVPATRHGVDPEGDGCRVWMTGPLWAPAYVPVLALALARIDEMARDAN